ncbi:VOC family protein [Tengunoibacter tsumagoiensis]|uniref:VOC family protein n=1 Tax=Tengunoibacter tsumagoiensis TaxID=2014871 RepID=UPI000F83A3AC
MKNYDNFFVPTNNPEEAKRFYHEVLGLPVKFDFEKAGLTAFKVGDQEAAIILQDITKHPDTKPAILFVVDDVNATYQELKAKGVRFLSEPYEIYTGLAIQFEDPFGNRLGLTDYSKSKQ